MVEKDEPLLLNKFNSPRPCNKPTAKYSFSTFEGILDIRGGALKGFGGYSKSCMILCTFLKGNCGVVVYQGQAEFSASTLGLSGFEGLGFAVVSREGNGRK